MPSLRNQSLGRRLFVVVILMTAAAMPILLLVSSDTDYEGLELRDSAALTGAVEGRPAARLGVVFDNNGDRKLRILRIDALAGPGPGQAIPGLTVRLSRDGTRRTGLLTFRRFILQIQRRRYIELSRPLTSCSASQQPQRVTRLLIRYEVFSKSEERRIDLPDPVLLPRCA